MMHALIVLVLASILYLMGIVFDDLPSLVKLYLCDTGTAFLFFGMVMCVFADEERRAR